MGSRGRASWLAVAIFGVAVAGCGADPADGGGVDPGSEMGLIEVTKESFGGVAVTASFEQVSPGFPERGGCIVLENFRPKEVSAGRLKVDLPGAANPLMIKPSQTHTYAGATSSPMLMAGDQVSVRAEGDTVGAFRLVGVMPPNPLVITSPKLSPSPLDVDRALGLGLSWNPGEGDVMVTLVNVGGKPTVLVECRFDAADGSGTMPGAAISAVPNETESTLSAQAFSVASTTVDDWTMILLVGSLAQGSHGRTLQQRVKLH